MTSSAPGGGGLGDFVFHALRSGAALPLAAVAGGLAQRALLPRITGYLLTGLLVGPYALGIVSEEAVKALWPVDYLCLSVIAVAAGSELQSSELHRTRAQVIYICGSICLATYLLVYLTLLAAAPLLSGMADFSSLQLHAFCSLAGCLMMARSPASAIAVLKETEARGPFTSLVMAVVVVKDVVVIAAFALSMEVARAVFSKDPEAALTLAGLLEPVLSLLASLAMGTAGAAVVGLLLRPKHGLLPAYLRPGLARKLQAGVILGLVVLMFGTADLLQCEPLLACVVVGLIATNRRHGSADAEKEELHRLLGAVMPVTNVPFFMLAGASLRLNALAGTLWLGGLVYGVRLGAIWAGCAWGAWMAGCPAEHRKQFWKSMVTQAGVAMGLAKTCAVRFPGWGDTFVTLMAGVIILNLLSGPPMFKAALVATGEARNMPGALLMSSKEADEYEQEDKKEWREPSPREHHHDRAEKGAGKPKRSVPQT
eukprot:jgi/Tetstr1/444557/TSEL_000287.t2